MNFSLVYLAIIALFVAMAGVIMELYQRNIENKSEIKRLEEDLAWHKESLRQYREARLADIRYSKEKLANDIKTASEVKG